MKHDVTLIADTEIKNVTHLDVIAKLIAAGALLRPAAHVQRDDREEGREQDKDERAGRGGDAGTGANAQETGPRFFIPATHLRNTMFIWANS